MLVSVHVCGVRSGNCQAWERWRLFIVDGSAMRSGCLWGDSPGCGLSYGSWDKLWQIHSTFLEYACSH